MTNLYPLQKTLCFELKPVGLTLEHFKKNNILEKAEKRAEEFKEIKKLLDKIHVDIIESGLEKLSKNEDFIKCLRSHEENRGYYIDSCNDLYEEKKKLNEYRCNKESKNKIKQQEEAVKKQEKEVNRKKKIKEDNDERLLTLVKNSLTDDYRYNRIFPHDEKDDKINLLKEYYKKDSEKMKLIDHFSDFISYFNKYDSRIEKLYGDKKISTTYKSVGYRLITDNLPIFHVNIEKIKEIKENITDIAFVEKIDNIENFADYLATVDINRYNYEIDNINSKIDIYNNDINSTKLPYLGKLYHLVDLDQDSDILKRISDDKELIEIINVFIKRIHLQNKDDIQNFKNIFSNLKKYDTQTTYIKNSEFVEDLLKKIFIRGLKYPYIAFDNVIKYDKWPEYRKTQNINTFFSEISNLADKVIKNYEEKYEKAKDILTATYEINEKKLSRTEENKSKDNIVRIKDLLESIKRDLEKRKENELQDILVRITDLLESIKKDLQKSGENKLKDSLVKIIDSLKSIEQDLEKREENKSQEILVRIRDLQESVKKDLERKDILVRIKDLLESLKLLSKFVSWFVPKTKANKDYTNFFKVNFKIYNELQPERLAKIEQIYSHVRAYFSLKNFSTRKIRFNFNANNCLKNWDNWNLQEIKENLGSIFRRKENGRTNYYLGIINKDNKDNFFGFRATEDSEDIYERMIYKKDKDSESSDFSMTFENIRKETIDEMIKNDELYLFQIYNQDFSEYSYGHKKIHTKYWNNIFCNENRAWKRFFINGGAKLFYRPGSLDSNIITHPENIPILNKNRHRLKDKETSTFEYPLIKDKRYTKDKLLFHVPITINNEADCELTKNQENGNIQEQLNKKILNKIKNGKVQHVIGISRSRDGLLQATVIDLCGTNKPSSSSLSTIRSECFDRQSNKIDFRQNYNRLLNNKEIERAEANNANNNNKAMTIQNIINNNDENLVTDKTIIEEWQSERSIKDFKNGYISQAVNEIAKRVVKYNAIVVFEDLDGNSEKVDSKIEKSMYEKLEKALVTKLSFLILDRILGKNLLPKQAGSAFKGFQLTYYGEKEKHRLEGKQSQIKQNGIIFYVPTNLTSNVDSKTGFINCFSLPKTFEDIKNFIDKFENVSEIIGDKEHYEFVMSYNKFINEGKDKNKFLRNDLLGNIETQEFKDNFLNHEWKLYSNGYFLHENGDSTQNSEELNLVHERWERVVEEEKDLLGSSIKTYNYKKIDLKEEFENLFKDITTKISKEDLTTKVSKEDILDFLNKDSESEQKNNRQPSEEMSKLLYSKNRKNPKEDFAKKFVRLLNLMLQMRNYNQKKDYEYIVSPVLDNDNKFFVSSAAVNVSKRIAEKGKLLVNKIKRNDFDLTITDEEWINHIIGKKFPNDKKVENNIASSTNEDENDDEDNVTMKDFAKFDGNNRFGNSNRSRNYNRLGNSNRRNFNNNNKRK